MTNPVSGRLFIGGDWSKPRDDFADRNPANLDEVVGTFPQATPDEVAAAVDAARAAFPAWRRTSRILRAEAFDRLAPAATDESREPEATALPAVADSPAIRDAFRISAAPRRRPVRNAG